MKRYTRVFFLLTLAFNFLIPVSVATPSSLKAIASFEDGHLYRANRFKVLTLSGSYRQMGRQYGHLLRPSIKAMHDQLVTTFTQQGIKCDTQTLDDFAWSSFSLYPKRIKDLAYGMAETSGLDIKSIAAINESFQYLLQCYRPPKSSDEGHCSAISTWGPYTHNRELIMGRNFDFPPYFRSFNSLITLVVYRPNDAHAVATITYPGQISSIQLFNDQGLVLENNNGSSSNDPDRYFGKRASFMIKDMSAMLDSDGIDSLNAALITARMPFPLIYNVASGTQATTYEMTTSEVKQRQGDNGLLLATNHFLHPEWPVSAGPGIEDSQKRYANLKALAEKQKGKLTPALMMALLDVTTDRDGATPADRNIYQFVYSPHSMTLWLKALTYSDWTMIELRSLFLPKTRKRQ